MILYIRNKSTGSLKWIRYSNKDTIVRSLPNQGNHHQWRTALHNYSQQMISLLHFLLHSYSGVIRLAFVARNIVRLKLEDKNRVMKPHWFPCRRDPFTEPLEGEMIWYEANKTWSPVFGGNQMIHRSVKLEPSSLLLILSFNPHEGIWSWHPHSVGRFSQKKKNNTTVEKQRISGNGCTSGIHMIFLCLFFT